MPPGLKALNISYIQHILDRYAAPGLSGCVRFLVQRMPFRCRKKDLYLQTGDIFVIAQKIEEQKSGEGVSR